MMKTCPSPSEYRYAITPVERNLYAEDIQNNLADLFDIGIHHCGYEGQSLIDAFLVSGLARQFEQNNPVYVAGKSAMDLLDIMQRYLPGRSEEERSPMEVRTKASPDYWAGWIASYVQLTTGCSYAQIFNAFPYERLRDLYYPLHEADPSKAVEAIVASMREIAEQETNLARQRHVVGLSQSNLAMRSGVSLRSIQMYEQRNKDINKASVETVYRLARTLHCSIETLLEPLQ